MNEEKFTPGPWHISAMGICDENQVDVFCRDNEEESLANSLLAVAAPDMYGVLKDLLPKLSAHGMRVDEVKQVMTKARGGR